MIVWLRRLLCAHDWCLVQGTLTLRCLRCGALARAACVHDWKVVDKTILPSAAEQVARFNFDGIGDVCEVFRKAVVLTLKCDKCGELRVERTVNP